MEIKFKWHFFFFTIFVTLIESGSLNIKHFFLAVFYFDRIPLWGALVASSVVGLLVSLLVQFILVPRQRKAILGSLGKFSQISFDSRMIYVF